MDELNYRLYSAEEGCSEWNFPECNAKAKKEKWINKKDPYTILTYLSNETTRKEMRKNGRNLIIWEDDWVYFSMVKDTNSQT